MLIAKQDTLVDETTHPILSAIYYVLILCSYSSDMLFLYMCIHVYPAMHCLLDLSNLSSLLLEFNFSLLCYTGNICGCMGGREICRIP